MHGSRTRLSPTSMHIERAEGGFIVNHHYDNSGAGESYQPSTRHVVRSHHDLVKHVQLHYGGTPPEAPSTQKRAPSTAAGHAASHKHGAGVD